MCAELKYFYIGSFDMANKNEDVVVQDMLENTLQIGWNKALYDNGIIPKSIYDNVNNILLKKQAEISSVTY